MCFWQRFKFLIHIVAVSHFRALVSLSMLLPLLFAANICCTGHQMIHSARAWLDLPRSLQALPEVVALSTQSGFVKQCMAVGLLTFPTELSG